MINIVVVSANMVIDLPRSSGKFCYRVFQSNLNLISISNDTPQSLWNKSKDEHYTHIETWDSFSRKYRGNVGVYFYYQ